MPNPTIAIAGLPLLDAPLRSALDFAALNSPPRSIAVLDNAALGLASTAANAGSSRPSHLGSVWANLGQWLQTHTLDKPKVLHRLPSNLAAQAQQQTFYHYPLSAEDGLLSPSSLSPFWPQLKPSRTQEIQTQTLDTFLRESQNLDSNWLVLPVLHSLSILQGAANYLPQADVVITRVATAPNSPVNDSVHLLDDKLQSLNPPELATLKATQDHLSQYGLSLFALYPQDNPAFALALFCRPVQHAQTQLEKLQTQLEQAQEQVKTLDAQKIDLGNQVAALKQAQTASLTLKTELETKLNSAEKNLSTLKTKLEQAQIKQLDELQKQLEQEKSARAAEASTSAERVKQLEQNLQNEKSALTALSVQHRQEQEKNKVLSDNLHALAQAKEETEKQTLTLKQAQAAASAQAQEQIETLQIQKTDLETQVTTLKQAQTEAINLKTNLELKLTSAEKNIAAHEATLEQQAEQLKQLETLRKQLHEEKTAREALSLAKEETEKQTLTLKQAQAAASAQAQEKIKTLEAQKTELVKQITDIKAEKENYKHWFEARKKQCIELEDTLKKLNKDTTKLEQIKKRNDTGDACIDDMLSDIAPYFFDRQLTYVDVGAFVGDVFLKILDNSSLKLREAHLFEPNPKSFETLKQRTDAVSLPMLRLYNVGIEANVSTRVLSTQESMSKVIGDIAPLGNQTNSFVSIPCSPLSDYFNCFTDQHIDLLKIDVEGGEIGVLKSIEPMLAEGKINTIYIEAGMNIHGTQQTYFGTIDALLQSLGYRVFKIYEQKNEWIQGLPILRRCNILYMSNRFYSANPVKLVSEVNTLREQLKSLRA